MRFALTVLAASLLVACGDKDEDTGDTAEVSEDTQSEEAEL